MARTEAPAENRISGVSGKECQPQGVMKWTGHSDYKAMRPYIDIAEKTKADAMKIIDNAWGE